MTLLPNPNGCTLCKHLSYKKNFKKIVRHHQADGQVGQGFKESKFLTTYLSSVLLPRWAFTLRNFFSVCLPNHVEDWFIEGPSGRYLKGSMILWNYVARVLLSWGIWSERNQRAFENKVAFFDDFSVQSTTSFEVTPFFTIL